MATEITFTVTKEMEQLLDNARKHYFTNHTQSDMLCELVLAGLNTLND